MAWSVPPLLEDMDLTQMSRQQLEAVLVAASAPVEERTEEEIGLLSSTLRCVPVLATLPEEAIWGMCEVALYEQ